MSSDSAPARLEMRRFIPAGDREFVTSSPRPPFRGRREKTARVAALFYGGGVFE
jgi:hypothetical protein